MPRITSRLLTLCVGPDLASSILGDFEEERRRRASQSRVLAHVWFYTNIARVAGYVVGQRAKNVTAMLAKRSVMDTLTSDLKQTLRAARRRPTATVALVLVLALGVGLTSAMFALADPFLLRPLPYVNPSRLVEISLPTNGITKETVLPTFEQWRQRRDLFVDLAAWSHFTREALTTADGSTEEVTSVRVSGNFFDVLNHEFDRTRGWPEFAKTRQAVLALTDRGQRKTGARLDQTLKDSSGSTRRIAAVLSPQFLFPSASRAPLLDAFTPFEPGPVIEVQRWSSRGTPSNSESLVLIGRLVPGVSAGQVSAALSWTDRTGQTISAEVFPLSERMTQRVRPVALGGLAAGTLILLVCIGNVANLLIARNAHRTREMATRAALGASRLALTRLALIESLVIASAGSVLGLTIAWLALAAVRTVIPVDYTALGSPELSGRVWTFAIAAGLLVTMLAAIPAWFARRGTSASVFGRHGSGDAPRVRPIRFLVTAIQSGFAVILLMGAALLVRSYANLISQDTGFDQETVAVSVRFPSGLSGPALRAGVEQATDQLRLLPGVLQAAASVGSMIDLVGSGIGLTVDGKGASTNRKAVTTEFFEATRLPIVAGRSLQQEDANMAGAVVNRTFVREYWPDANAVGRTVGFGQRAVPVVGVADDAFDVALDAAPQPTVFVLLDNIPASGLTFLIHGSGDGEALREPVRRALSAAIPGIAIREYSTIGQRLSQTVRDRSFATLMLTFFAVAALSVSAAGVIGVVMFIVAGRTREIAIRVAIGAQSSHVRWLVMREAFWAATTGAVTGAIAGRWLSGSVESFVYGIEAGSWSTTVLAVGTAILLMALAVLLPARRALLLDPTTALRVE